MLKHLVLLIGIGIFVTACTPARHDEMSDMNNHMEQKNEMEMKDEHMGHGDEMEMSMDLDRLIDSPRHHEWVEVKNGEKTIHTWVVYPEVSEKKPVVLLIHENRGLNDWARSMADQVAEAGYIAVAPDLLSDFSATEKKTTDFANEDEARTALGTLDPDQVMSDLQAVADWAKTIPSANGKLASAGFCWGGAKSFEFGTKRDDLAAVMVFYGSSLSDASAYAKIAAPVYGFYGGADERINAGIPQTEEAMKAAGKSYDYKIYEGAGHAFMRSGEDPAGEKDNVEARNAAFERMKEILNGL